VRQRRISPIALTLLLGCVFLLVGALMRVGASTDRQAFRDLFVAVTSCSSTGTSPATAEVLYTVSNRGTAERGATVRIEYRDAAGARIGTDIGRVGRIAAGTTVLSGKSTVLRSPVGPVRCRVVPVE
jgi:hypothetical protein